MKGFGYKRRQTTEVKVGDVAIGSENHIVVQSMTTTPTGETNPTVEQIMRIADAGGEIVRMTAQGRAQAENLGNIRRELRFLGCEVPLAADIHFNPALALIAARHVEKVRINPGNFIDKPSDLPQTEPADGEYEAEPEGLRKKLAELIDVCRAHGTAIRIGVNHGSLSGRITARWGDTPKGMTESAMEFLRICRDERFDQVVVSMKSSNTRVMVEAYRMVARAMEAEGMSYPLHLGVTEAGEGEDGRIRSAVGIGTLLAEGLGDTIRVSLTEPPEHEIAPARILAGYFEGRQLQNDIPVEAEPLSCDPLRYSRRRSAWDTVRVIAEGGDVDPGSIAVITPAEAKGGKEGYISVTLEDLVGEFLDWLTGNPGKPLMLSSENPNWTGEIRAAFTLLMRRGAANPVVLYRDYGNIGYDELQIYAASDFGALFIDGLGDGIWIDSAHTAKHAGLSFAILQASRLRITKTEIISCPGCGRTLFDLIDAVRKVKERFADRPGLKIAVMGCIVNGPGEMADADYGYVGAGPDRVTLYRAGEAVERNIPQEEALGKLEEMIKQDKKWM